MRSLSYFRLYFFLAALSLASAHSAKLNITAVAARNGVSHFECWELNTPFTSSNQSGLVKTRTASLGDVSKMTYNVVPAGFDGGFHPAPSNQWVILLSGLGVITLPDNTSTTITANGGGFGLVFATDTADRTRQGHGSIFPGVTESIALQIPTRNNEIPKHRVLYHDKPCTVAEVAGLRSWAFEN
ncbi:small secreted protein [Colletotrichum karsti]|uniref:Small secreted protein n=1 Tax=Colletotrichum karsti TaxID=1095194 RepID=A0A9P6LCN3_9PEZI|nr:small secreted protein [Colletotrichum karsti]KAF9869309.1 small secreted protein [Colletotrichum karsti]